MGELIIQCQCGHEMRVPATALGKRGTCGLCGQTLVATQENTRPAAPPRPHQEKPKPQPSPSRRIASLDQLRGYAIFGMIFVNYLSFGWVPSWISHQRTTFSYADTIAPLFVFVVGMGFRLSMKRRIETVGVWGARLAALKRYLILLVVAVAFYGPSYQKDWWDALTHIALAGLITLPFIDKPAGVRIGAAVAFLAAFTVIMFQTGYATWLQYESMNGGPLGTLGYAFTLLFGTIAYDLMMTGDARGIVMCSSIAAVSMMVCALIVWKAVPYDRVAELTEEFGPYWPFAKRWSEAPFILLSTGLCFVAFLFFYYVCDVMGHTIPHLSVLGENPLVIYLVQYSLLEMNGHYIGPRSPVWLGILGFVLFYLFNYAVAWRLHKDKIVIKL